MEASALTMKPPSQFHNTVEQNADAEIKLVLLILLFCVAQLELSADNFNSEVRIRSLASGSYICLSRKGRVVVMVNKHSFNIISNPAFKNISFKRPLQAGTSVLIATVN